MLDLGGGSLQLVAVKGRRAQAVGSWPLGAVRVTERLLPGSGSVPRKQLKRARAVVREELDGATWLGDTGRHVVAMGGAVRTSPLRRSACAAPRRPASRATSRGR